MRISDWSSDVCSSDLSQSQSLVSRKPVRAAEKPRALPWLLWERLQPRDLDLWCRSEKLAAEAAPTAMRVGASTASLRTVRTRQCHPARSPSPSRRRARSSRPTSTRRSEEHTSELQSLMRISYAVFCVKTKNTHK